MFGLSAPAPVMPRDFSACSGCSLCFLVCPMWRASRDPRFSPEGIAKALQCGATAVDLAAPLEACSLCGACDPVCPERIDLSAMIMDLRLHAADSLPSRAPRPAVLDDLEARLQQGAGKAVTPIQGASVLFLPGAELRADAALLARIESLLGLVAIDDDGTDIVLALEAGVPIPQRRMETLLAALCGHAIVGGEGLLVRQLRRWLPGSQRMGLGTALSLRAAVRGKLETSDLYVIEPRAFHADYERMVGHYDRLQRETGCSLSLDLQRIAVPARSSGVAQKLGLAAEGDAAQAKWLLQGRKPARIVVESLADRAALQAVSNVPVLHVAELAQGSGNE